MVIIAKEGIWGLESVSYHAEKIKKNRLKYIFFFFLCELFQLVVREQGEILLVSILYVESQFFFSCQIGSESVCVTSFRVRKLWKQHCHTQCFLIPPVLDVTLGNMSLRGGLKIKWCLYLVSLLWPMEDLETWLGEVG